MSEEDILNTNFSTTIASSSTDILAVSAKPTHSITSDAIASSTTYRDVAIVFESIDFD